MMDKSKRIIFCLSLSGAILLGLFLYFSFPTRIVQASITNFFVSPSGSGTLCTPANPCSLQTALTNAGQDNVIYLAQGTYTASPCTVGVAHIDKSIKLYGGWDGSSSLPVIHDPLLHPSILDGQDQCRVVEISGNITPTLDGLTITRGNATNKVTDCYASGGAPDGCGGGIFSYNAHPIITHNIISDNVATRQTKGYPDGVTGYGGGIYLRNADRAIIQDNLIISNTGSTINCGYGGGIALASSGNQAIIQQNQVLSNTATTKNVGCAWGGGIAGGPNGALIQFNRIEGNRVNPFGGGSGAGIYLWTSGATYRGNLVRRNSGSSAVYLGYSQSQFQGNLVIDNPAADGIQLTCGSTSYAVWLVNNIIQINGSGHAISLDSANPQMITARLIHNTLVGSNAGSGIYLEGDYHTIYMTNTIVTGFTWGIDPALPVHYTLQLNHTLFWNNSNNGAVGVSPVYGNPLFINPSLHDYHLGLGSSAIDAGVGAGILEDFDFDPRPFGLLPDIGADELGIWIYLPIALR